MELRVAVVGSAARWNKGQTSPSRVELVVEASDPGGFPASAAGGFGLGVYSLLLLSEEGHVLLYRQISQPESVSFVGRAALRRMRAILLHNRWIGVDSSVEVSAEEPGRAEELATAQRASQQSNKPTKQSSKSNKSSKSNQPSITSSQKPLSPTQQTSPFFAHPSSPPPLQNPSNEPKPPANDESQDLLAFISWEDSTPIAPPPPAPRPPTSKANDRKRPPSLPQPSPKRADTIQMESFLNSLFS